MFGIGEGELLIIVLFGFLLFGPDRLPAMGRTIGRMLRQFRHAQEGFTEVVQAEVMDPLQQAMNDPLDETQQKKYAERQASFDEDADLDEDASAGAKPAKKESFAERKARLEREKAEAQAQAEAQAAAAAVELQEAEAAHAQELTNQTTAHASDEVTSTSNTEAKNAAPSDQATNDADGSSNTAAPGQDKTAAPSSARDLYAMKRPSKKAQGGDE